MKIERSSFDFSLYCDRHINGKEVFVHNFLFIHDMIIVNPYAFIIIIISFFHET